MTGLLQGNIAWDDEYCFIDDKFREKVTESPGFEWLDEAKPHHLTKKEGYIATKPGAHLLLTVNTAETTQAEVKWWSEGTWPDVKSVLWRRYVAKPHTVTKKEGFVVRTCC